MAGNPVTYAEQNLQVHAVYEEATQTWVDLAELQQKLAEVTHGLYVLREQMADAEVEVVIDMRALAGDAPEWKYKEALKCALRTDGRTAAIRTAITPVVQEQALLESKIKIMERRLNILTARLSQLGGLLTFYAMRSPAPKSQVEQVPQEASQQS